VYDWMMGLVCRLCINISSIVSTPPQDDNSRLQVHGHSVAFTFAEQRSKENPHGECRGDIFLDSCPTIALSPAVTASKKSIPSRKKVEGQKL